MRAKTRYESLALSLLLDEALASRITPDMFSILDRLIDEAKAKGIQPYRPGMTPADSLEFARANLTKIDCLLLSHGFVYPDRGLVTLLSDSLRLTAYNDGDYTVLRNDPRNLRRRRFMDQTTDHQFYVTDCDTASFVYLAIAKELGYPLFMVERPTHNFLRWDDGGTTLDFETMLGVEQPERLYLGDTQAGDIIYFEKMSTEELATGAYMVDMTPDQISSYHEAVVANVLTKLRSYRWAAAAYEKAYGLNRDRPGLANSIAWFYAVVPDAGIRDGRKAQYYAKIAVRQRKASDELDTQACAFALAGNYRQARRAADLAVKLATSPDMTGIRLRRGYLHKNNAYICEDANFLVTRKDPSDHKQTGDFRDYLNR